MMEQMLNEKQVIGRMKRFRIELHHKIIYHMREIGLCDSEQVVEHFKRWYLFDHHAVETSRALSVKGLETAKKDLKNVTAAEAVEGIMRKYRAYECANELYICTQRQINKIYAIAIGSVNMDKQKMYNYFNSTLHRKVFKFNMSVAEADLVIKRLEQFEAKQMRVNHEQKNARRGDR